MLPRQKIKTKQDRACHDSRQNRHQGAASGLRLRTLTTDNGIENKQHMIITKKTGAPVFFTNPYSSWQKDGVENANKMLRRCFSKGTDFSKGTQVEVHAALWTINNRPRQSLGYKRVARICILWHIFAIVGTAATSL